MPLPPMEPYESEKQAAAKLKTSEDQVGGEEARIAQIVDIARLLSAKGEVDRRSSSIRRSWPSSRPWET